MLMFESDNELFESKELYCNEFKRKRKSYELDLRVVTRKFTSYPGIYELGLAASSSYQGSISHRNSS